MATRLQLVGRWFAAFIIGLPLSTDGSLWSACAAGAARQELSIRAMSMELGDYEPGANRERVSLKTSFTLTAPAAGWVEVRVTVPDGFRLPPYEAGEQAAFDFRGPSDFLGFTLLLERIADRPGITFAPLSFRLDEKRTDLGLFMWHSEMGFAACIVPLGAQGEIMLAGAEEQRQLGGWWLFATTVQDAMSFVAALLGVRIDLPSELAAWVRCGTGPSSTENLLLNLAHSAGCESVRVDDTSYIIAARRDCRVAADGSWHVLKDHGKFRLHGEQVPVADLLWAVVDLAGYRIAAMPDSLDTRISVSHATYTLAEALEVICSQARLTWSSHEGVYRFEPKHNGE